MSDPREGAKAPLGEPNHGAFIAQGGALGVLPCWLIDDGQMSVLEDDIELDLSLSRRSVTPGHRDPVPDAHGP